jgi:OOP family OmpA-OmpF porin
MDQIETQLQPVEQIEVAEEIEAPAVAPIEEVAFGSEVFDIDPAQPMAVENAMYLIFFNWDSAVIGSGALSIVDAVVDEINKTQPSSVSIVGHTDTSGPKDYNQRLALKRAKAAKDKLVERGVNPAMIMMDAKGETDLLVPTPDNVREPANRRVNISFQR